MELIASKVKDAVATFLDVEYMQMVMDRIEDKAATPLDDPAAAVELVATTMRYTDEQRAGILDHFIKGGQVTAGGMLNAITSYVQTVDDPDTAYDIELSAMDAFDLVARG